MGLMTYWKFLTRGLDIFKDVGYARFALAKSSETGTGQWKTIISRTATL
jgi:hypothetical protein